MIPAQVRRRIRLRQQSADDTLIRSGADMDTRRQVCWEISRDMLMEHRSPYEMSRARMSSGHYELFFAEGLREETRHLVGQAADEIQAAIGPWWDVVQVAECTIRIHARRSPRL